MLLIILKKQREEGGIQFGGNKKKNIILTLYCIHLFCQQHNIMGRQGDSFTIRKREDVSRERDTNVVQVQEPHTTELAFKDHYDDSSDFTQLKSREIALGEILKMLQDDQISRVSLYGMGGVGKTILAKQVGIRAKKMCIFNLVVFVRVAIFPSVKTIQRDIADQLGLRLGEGDLQGQISLRLRNNEERVLIIFDDVWERLDLQGIGVLDDGSQIGCKVLLTSHIREAGFVMGFQHFYNLLLLSREEAWYLFRKRACIDDGCPDLIFLARKIAECCEGSPFAISLLGSLLRGKTVKQWRKVSETLGASQGDTTGRTLHIMRLSCEAISSKVAKAVLFIGTLFPRSHEILIEDLSRYAIRPGLCSSKSEVSAAIITLKDSCFLMRSHKSKDHVIMHNMVRDVTVRMVCSENPTYEARILGYLYALHNEEEDFQWQEKLDRLLCQLYGVSEHLSSSTSNSTSFYGDGGGGEGRELQVMRSYSSTKAAAMPKPSGKLADFYGLCRVDKSFLPLLKEACAMKPQLIESQRRHSEMLRQSAFECLGRVLFLLHNVRSRDWVDVNRKSELEMFWEQLKAFKFDLGWLGPVVEGVFSSAEIARIEALREEEKYWSEEAARRREHLKIAESKVADIRTEIARAESELNGFAIAQVFNVRAVSKVTPTWKKIFFKK